MTDRTPALPPWATARLDEIRVMLAHSRFEETIELAAECGARAAAEGDLAAWGRFTSFRSTALTRLGLSREALALADDVAASASAERDAVLVVDAACAGALAAYRVPDDDAMLARLDVALAEGEVLLALGGGAEPLGKAAIVAGAVGVADLGDALFTRILAAARDLGGDVSPRNMLWIRANHTMARLQRALQAEHAGAAEGAAELFGQCAEMCRTLVGSLPDPSLMPPKPAASLQAIEGFALAALGRVDEAAPLLDACTAVLGGPFETLTATIEVLHGAAALRTGTIATADAWREATRLAAVAQRAGEARLEAEIWLRAARHATAGARSAIARDRFTALVERLDWRRRLHGAQLLGFRSATLRLVAQDEVADHARGT
jgi:hypothetical protein